VVLKPEEEAVFVEVEGKEKKGEGGLKGKRGAALVP